jgi:hypothetical protein
MKRDERSGIFWTDFLCLYISRFTTCQLSFNFNLCYIHCSFNTEIQRERLRSLKSTACISAKNFGTRVWFFFYEARVDNCNATPYTRIRDVIHMICQRQKILYQYVRIHRIPKTQRWRIRPLYNDNNMTEPHAMKDKDTNAKKKSCKQ